MSYHSMGAVGPGGYPVRTLCLTDQNGMQVKSLYARNPMKFGNIYSLYDVCFKTKSVNMTAPKLNVRYGSNTRQCVSNKIRDMYGELVCFYPAKSNVRTKSKPAKSIYSRQQSETPQPVNTTPQRDFVSDDGAEEMEAEASFNASLTADPLVADTPTAIQVSTQTIHSATPEDAAPVLQSEASLNEGTPSEFWSTSELISQAQAMQAQQQAQAMQAQQQAQAMQAQQQQAAEEEDKNKNVLIIGGILAAIVVVGGVAYVATRK